MTMGQIIGNYRVEREIGEGGMSHVFIGRTLASTEVLPSDFNVVLKMVRNGLKRILGTEAYLRWRRRYLRARGAR